jgi:hypothetical protein
MNHWSTIQRKCWIVGEHVHIRLSLWICFHNLPGLYTAGQ